MSYILFVRIESELPFNELMRRVQERRPRFLEIPGLLQKYYGHDEASGAVCGVYIFDSQESLHAFRETELAKTIPSAYEATDLRPEIYEVLFPLRPESVHG